MGPPAVDCAPSTRGSRPSFPGPSPVSLTAERTPKKKPAVQSPEKQRPKGRSSDGASAPPPARSAGVGVPSSGPTGESPPPDPSFEAAEDVGQFQLPPGPPARAPMGPGPAPCPHWRLAFFPHLSPTFFPAQQPVAGGSQAYATAASRPWGTAGSCAWHTLPSPPRPTVPPMRRRVGPPQEDLGRPEGKWRPPCWGHTGAGGPSRPGQGVRLLGGAHSPPGPSVHISLEGPVGGTVVGGGPGLARQSAHSPRGQLPSSPQDQRVGPPPPGWPSLSPPPLPASWAVTQVPPALFWPHFGLGAVEPPAGWLPCLFQSENALALTLTPGFPPGTQHSVLWQAHKEVGEPEVSSTSGASHPIPAGMGPWLALWVLLYLPRALQGQSPHTRAAPSSVLQSFEDSKFQGEWYVLGLAGNTHTVADRSLLSPFTATFVLNKNNHLEAAYAMIRVRAPGPASQLKSRAQPELSQARHGPETPSLERVPRVHFGSGSRPRNGQRVDLMEATDGGQRCVTWSYELISQSQPGTFSVDHSGAEEIQVYDTDYASFALLLSKKQSDLQRILRVSLLCRIWAIQTQVLDKFVCLVRAQGLSDDSIVFPDLTEGLEDRTQRPQAGEGELGLLPLTVQGQGRRRAEAASRDTNRSLSAGHHPFPSLFPVHPRVYQPGGVGPASGLPFPQPRPGPALQSGPALRAPPSGLALSSRLGLYLSPWESWLDVPPYILGGSVTSLSPGRVSITWNPTSTL
nr:PREDICTED: epididymal-specific lipocalin-12 [Bos mutus]